ncbi:hypothetical protein BJ165DRAFT_955596 [Panaeolus papilionaceus]|nr:hypothetical protein BJ165DRAFT_955596 [Panaeolus papilionaceus]
MAPHNPCYVFPVASSASVCTCHLHFPCRMISFHILPSDVWPSVLIPIIERFFLIYDPFHLIDPFIGPEESRFIAIRNPQLKPWEVIWTTHPYRHSSGFPLQCCGILFHLFPANPLCTGSFCPLPFVLLLIIFVRAFDAVIPSWSFPLYLARMDGFLHTLFFFFSINSHITQEHCLIIPFRSFHAWPLGFPFTQVDLLHYSRIPFSFQLCYLLSAYLNFISCISPFKLYIVFFSPSG